MTPEELHQKHTQEWQDYWLSQTDEYGQYRQSRQDKEQYHGFKQLLENQRKEIAALKRAQTIKSEFKDNASDISEQGFMYENLEGRHKEWAELQHDHKAIEDYYKAKGVEVPKATQNRMKQHIENYKQTHGIPYTPDETLEPKTEKDFALYQNVHEIYEADFAISQSYEMVPDSTNDRLRQDLTEYFSMNEVYHAMRQENSFVNKVADKYQQWQEQRKSNAADKMSKNERKEEFKKQFQPKSGQSQTPDKGIDID